MCALVLSIVCLPNVRVGVVHVYINKFTLLALQTYTFVITE